MMINIDWEKIIPSLLSTEYSPLIISISGIVGVFAVYEHYKTFNTNEYNKVLPASDDIPPKIVEKNKLSKNA